MQFGGQGRCWRLPSQSIRRPSPRSWCSAPTMDTTAAVLDSDRASTRSTGLRPRRIPRCGSTGSRPTAARGVPRRRPASSSGQSGAASGRQPVLDQQAPSRRRWAGRAVLLGEPGAGGRPSRPAWCRRRTARQARSGCSRSSVGPRRAVGPRSRGVAASARNGIEPNAGRGQLRDQLGEPLGLARRASRSPAACGVGQPGKLDERRQVALLDHRRDRRGGRAVPPNSSSTRTAWSAAESLGRGGGQARGPRACGSSAEQLGQQPAPDLEQVVALVQDQQQRTGRPELLDERAPVVVETGQERWR